LTNLLQTGGSLNSQTTSLNSQLSALQTQKTNEQQVLDTYQASLQAQFSAMETIVGQYNDSGTFLSNWVKSSSSSGG